MCLNLFYKAIIDQLVDQQVGNLDDGLIDGFRSDGFCLRRPHQFFPGHIVQICFEADDLFTA